MAAAVMTNVFALNVCYGVHVKLYSMHLLIMSLVLVAPDVPRLFSFFVLKRNVLPRVEPQLFKTRWFNWLSMAILLLMFGVQIYNHLALNTKALASLQKKSPFYGIWCVDEFRLNGKVLPPLLTDNTRLQYIVFDAPDTVTAIPMDQKAKTLYAELRSDRKSLLLGTLSNQAEVSRAARWGGQVTPKFVSKQVFAVSQKD